MTATLLSDDVAFGDFEDDESGGEDRRYMPQSRAQELFKACMDAAQSKTECPSGYDIGRALARMYPYSGIQDGTIVARLYRGMIECFADRTGQTAPTQEDLEIFQALTQPEHYQGMDASSGCALPAEKVGAALARLGVDRNGLQDGLFWGSGTDLDKMGFPHLDIPDRG